MDEQPIYRPTEEEQKRVSRIMERFRQAEKLRNTSYRYFNDRVLEEYIQDSVDRWNGYVAPRADPAADWGALVFTNKTRNKTISILGQVTAERTKAEFSPQNDDELEDKAVSDLCRNLNDHAAYILKDEIQQFLGSLEAVTKGTVIGFTSFKRDKRTVREVTGYDFETGEVEYDEKEVEDWNDVYDEILPLQDFYPGNIYLNVFEMQKQPFLFWRSVIPMETFKSQFGRYKNANEVPAMSETLRQNDLYKDFLSQDVGEGEVEVLRYFCRGDDDMQILANGVPLTPRISPFPWNSKRYPFWGSVFEFFAVDFFYGKSLPDKLRNDQDVLNDLYRMMLDQTFLSIHKPIVTTSVQGIMNHGLWPGKEIHVEDVQQFREFDISPPEQSQFSMLKLVQDSMDEASVDNPSQGISGSNSTAFEVSVAREAATKLLALFLRSLEWGVWMKTELRLLNQFQFYRQPITSTILSDEGEQQYATYRTLKIPKTTLADGSTGTQVVRLVQDETMFPSMGQIDKREQDMMKMGRNVAFSYVSVKSLKNLDVLVHIVPNSSVKMSEALKRALELDYQQKASMLYPDLLNRVEAFRDMNEVYGKDPNRLMSPVPQQPMMPNAPPGGIQPNQTPNVAAPKLPVKSGEAAMGANEMMNSPRGFIREGAQRA